jgi:hypothetical protein|nr:MAG: replication associated protein [Cressdnaviricota sp.]
MSDLSDRHRSRGFVFTRNNYEEFEWELLCGLLPQHSRWCIIGREKGKAGTPHLQGAVYFTDAKSVKSVRKLLLEGKCHVEIMQGTCRENFAYCSKENDFFTSGECPPDSKDKGAAERERWQAIMENAKDGAFECIPPRVRIQYYETFKRIRADFCKCDERLDNLDAEWIWGPPGTGKSWAAREENPVYYLKNSNKWWCGYDMEPVVIIEELELEAGKFIGHFLKIWSDIYPFRGEVKRGSTGLIRPKKIVITSNYSIDQVFSHDVMLCAAVKRRFNERHFVIKFNK